jgi:hypothetical protein
MKNRAIALIISLIASSGIAIYNYTGEDVILPDGTEFSTRNLPEHISKEYKNRSLEDSLYIFIHHTASPSSAKIENIAKWHVNHNGWPRIAYHSGIKSNGDILILNDLETLSYHTKGSNTKGISIVLLGNYNEEEITEDQLESLEILTDALCRTLKIKGIMGHRDAPNAHTSCPGDNAYELLTKELFY